ISWRSSGPGGFPRGAVPRGERASGCPVTALGPDQVRRGRARDLEYVPPCRGGGRSLDRRRRGETMLTLRCDGRARTAAGDSSTSHDRGLRRATLAVLGWLWTLGCASISAPPAPPAAPADAVAKPSVVAVPPLSPDALATLREQAPEIALDLERLHVLARKHAADGRSEDALELAATTEHLLQIAVASLPA